MYLSLVSQNVLSPGGVVTYTIEFKNSGLTTATQVLVTDTLSSWVQVAQIVSSGGAITLTSTSPLNWQVADLAPGEGGVITISAAIQTGLNTGEVITNAAQVSALMSDATYLEMTRAKQGTIMNWYHVLLPMIVKP